MASPDLKSAAPLGREGSTPFPGIAGISRLASRRESASHTSRYHRSYHRYASSGLHTLLLLGVLALAVAYQPSTADSGPTEPNAQHSEGPRGGAEPTRGSSAATVGMATAHGASRQPSTTRPAAAGPSRQGEASATHSPHPSASRPTARTHSPDWVRATLSHYGTCREYDPSRGCDGYLGKRTKCGKTVTTESRFVAALKPELAHCGMRITILYRGRRYHVRVQDRGADRKDDRALDAAPGLRRLLKFDGVTRVRFVRGWR